LKSSRSEKADFSQIDVPGYYGKKGFVIALVEASVVRHIVVRTQVPTDIIVNNEEGVASNKAIDTRLLTQIRPIQRIDLTDSLNFFRR